MNSIIGQKPNRASLRLVFTAALTLGALALLTLASPAHATSPVPTITNVTCTPNPILAVGAIVTVTAKVTASTSGLSSVILYENKPNISSFSGYFQRTAPMTVGSDGVTYTATVPVDLNTNSNANGERLFIQAIDPANNVTNTVVATQGYDNIPPVISHVTYSPDPIPVQGATVTVTAQVVDAGVGLSSVILYENEPNISSFSGYFQRIAPMAVGSDGVTYTAIVPVDLNSNTGANGERLFIEAIDAANNVTDDVIATQGYSSVPATGSLPVLVTADASQPVLSPASVAASSGAVLPLTINGINFASGAVVLFNGVQLLPGSQTDRQLVVNVPASLIAQAGSYAVTVVDPSPSSASNTVNFIVKANVASTTHIQWTNTDGRFSLWNYDPITGNNTQFTYGPYANWTAKSVADGPDGKTRVLWDNTNGQMSLWDLDNTTGSFTSRNFGPYAGWSATGVSVSP